MRAPQAEPVLDAIDKAIINDLQDGFPIADRPYAVAAAKLGIAEAELITRLKRLLDEKILTRFGPMYHAERMGGGLALAAMNVPQEEFERVAEQVNSLPEIAHNYERNHEFNMWFVIATETLQEVEEVVQRLQQRTGYKVYNMPKIEEFYVGLRFRL
jgi:DNA-binding Lrp family transcriptional regulator